MSVRLPFQAKKRAGLRATMHRFEREGYVFSIIPSPITNELYTQLKRVSDAWLDGKRKKGFSLGYFDLDYINRAPVATIADEKWSYYCVYDSYAGLPAQ
ncbi:hypothetical protein GCM10020331_092530 [Ectobacillus funiculus]